MGKSSRHKSENTFHFQTFSERIASINIDVIHQIRHHDDTPEDVSTYFWETMEKHMELNCTAHFSNFRKEISDKVRSTTQLVHHKDTIVTSLKTHLLIPESMALQALMDLVVALGRDLQMDFYPHFREFFDILVQLLGTYTQDVEVLEQIFTCLSYLFKFLWRYLIKDIEPVYEYFSSLLSQKYKEYIRNFSAECFGFLMRKVKDHSGLFDFLFSTLKEHPEKAEGLGRLLFEMMKGVKQQFHSSSTKIFPILVSKLGSIKDVSDETLPWEHIETSFRIMLLSMMKHGDTEHIEPLIDMFVVSMKNQFQIYLLAKGKKNKTAASDTFIRFLRLGKCIVDFKNASMVTKPDNIGKILTEFLQESASPDSVCEPLLAVCSTLVVRCHTKMEVQVTARLISTVFKTKYPVQAVYDFVRSLFKLPVFEKNVLPYLLPYCDKHVAMGTESCDQTLLLVTELLLLRSPLLSNGSDLENVDTYMLDFGPKSKFPHVICSMITEVKGKKDRHTMIQFWIALVCAPHVRPLKTEGLMEIMADFIVTNLSGADVLDPDISFVMAQVLVVMATLGDSTFNLCASISPDVVLDGLLKHSDSVHYLRFVDIYMSLCVQQKDKEWCTEEMFNKVFPALQDNLSSPVSLIRLLTLRILTNFHLTRPETESDVEDVLQICLSAETVPVTVQTYRDRLRYLQKLEYTDVQKFIPNQTLQQVPLRYLIGSIFINFKLLWQPLQQLISSHAHGMEKNMFWEVLGKHLSSAAVNCRKENADDTGDSNIGDNAEGLESVFADSMKETVYSDQTPDFANFRIQLWKSMQRFPEKCEPKSKMFIPHFFDFLRLEYNAIDVVGLAQTQDILKKPSDDSTGTPAKGMKRKPGNDTGTDKEESTKDISPKKHKSDTGQAGKSTVSDANSNPEEDPENIPQRRYRTRLSSRSENPESMEVDQDEETGVSGDDKVSSGQWASSSRTKPIPDKGNKKQHRPVTRSLGKVEEVDSENSDSDDDEDDVENDGIDEQGDKTVKPSQMADDSEDEEAEKEFKETKKSGFQKTNRRHKTELSTKGNTRKAVTTTLLVQLELFAKFKNQKSIHREPELRELYFELLLHKNPLVQKAAFTCIAGYKDKYLMPYKENFNRLLDDSTFKNELVCFSIDDTNSIIDPTHRAEVLPILMRILHGKMHSKTGAGTGGRRGIGARQPIILRFLHGSREEELKIFIDLIFKPFMEFISDDLHQKVKEIRSSVDFTKVVSIKKTQGVMSSMEVILKKLGHMVDSYLPYMLQIVVGLGTLSSVCLESRDQLLPFVHTPLKKIRQMSMSRVTQIFIDYDNYEWGAVEIDGIFEGLVWPQLGKLHTDGYDSPNPLLRFFVALSKNPRYFSLLAKHHESNVKLTPLVHVMKLLSHKEASKTVAAVILEMVNNLLLEQDSEEEVTTPTVHVNHMLKLDEESRMGVALLRPHIDTILHYLEKTIKSLFTRQNRKQETFIELDILSKISCFVTDGDLCKTLITLLLPFLQKKKSQKAEEDIILSIENLLRLVDDRTAFIPTMCRLFASLVQKNSRVLLSKVFVMMCEGHEDLLKLAEIVQQLNSFDSKRVDEPDYLQRLAGYRAANSLVRSMTKMDKNICVAIVNNCCHVINTTEDMSLRDASTNCLVTIVTQFGNLDYNDYAYRTVINEVLLQEVKGGLHNRLEVVRHEYVVVLTSLIDTFKDVHPFSELRELRDTTDTEADFFENIKHIQMHKRSRGMARLIKHLGKHDMKCNTLLTYFLPLVTSFLTDHYRKHNALQDTAVETLRIICKQLPWKQYYFHLQHYIQLLPKRPDSQRLIVRAIVAILHAFHFDMSNSTFDMKLSPFTEKEEAVEDKKPKKESETDEIPEVEIPVDSDDDDDRETLELNKTEEEKAQSGKRHLQPCSEKLATKIHFVIAKKLIFQLRKILVQKVETENQHKVNKSKYAEDDEILRVPIALAMVKLLQHLPSGALERFLPGVLLKVCNFLRSKSIDIRTTARDTLLKIQMALGTRYFPFLLSELRTCLKLGYQRHILCYTVHMILVKISDLLQPGDIDVCLKSLQEVLNEEIFGEMSEEKEVKAITFKLLEAKSSKSFDSYKLIASHITKNALMKLIQPLKEILDGTHSSKVAIKVQAVLKTVVLGLVDNKNLTLEHLLVFIHGLVSQTLPMLMEKKDPGKEEKTVNANLLEKKPEHSLLLKDEMPRGGHKPKANKKTNLHILVEFGLEMLNSCRKRSKINTHNNQHLQMLDPLVPLLTDCLYSKYPRVNAFTLRNLCWMVNVNLPSVKEHIGKIADGMFILLRTNATPGTSKGDNMELLAMLFKAVTVLVRDCKFYPIKTERLQVLLSFCEEDLYDYNRQSTAFSLLKAIISRKVRLSQIEDIIKKLEEMSITADAPHVKRECRQVVIHYLLDYPLGKKIAKHIEFYISQLSYEMESGRESALEMMATFFTSFPQKTLAEYSSLFFIPMSANLVNDESAKCRKLTALALKSLLTNIDHNNRTQLFGFVMEWFNHSQLRNRSLASQLCGQFVEVEGQKFEGRLTDILPVLEQQLEPGKYSTKVTESAEQKQDHMIYNTLNTLLKILTECNFVVSDKKWISSMNVIWDYVNHYLMYPHLWVQLVSCQLFGVLFGATQPDQIFSQSKQEENEPAYLMTDSLIKFQKLAMYFTSQLQSELLNEDLANQVVKNMVFICKCAKYLYNEPKGEKPDKQEEEKANEGEEEEEEIEGEEEQEEAIEGEEEEEVEGEEEEMEGEKGNKIFTLPWIVRKMVREAHHEAIHHKKQILKRSSVFKWMAAVSLDLGEEILSSVLRNLLPPLQREIEDDSTLQNPALKSLAQEVLELLKKSVGLETFTMIYAAVQKERVERKEDRKRKRTIQAINDPHVAARRKIKKHLTKVVAKKRKIEEKKRPFKQSKHAKKKKYEEFTIDLD